MSTVPPEITSVAALRRALKFELESELWVVGVVSGANFEDFNKAL